MNKLTILWRKVHCFGYKLYDRSKSNWFVNRIFYRGGMYKHYGNLTLTGTITKINGGSLDGDWTFDIENYAVGTIHCEVTPCYPIDESILKSLSVGYTIVVTGTSTFDPTHLSIPDHWEIHPVKKIVILKA